MNRFKPIDRKRARMQLALDPESPVALFVGRFAPVKGLAHLLEAIAELVPRFPRLRLLIVGGDGPEADTSLVLLQQAEKLGVLAHLTMVGRIDHDDLPLYYSAADLLVLPSSYESFGLVTLEALACGTPVAATATGGAASIIREGVNGTFFDRLDGTSISQGIERVLIQARQRKYSVDRLRTAATALSWDRISALILKTYHSLLS